MILCAVNFDLAEVFVDLDHGVVEIRGGHIEIVNVSVHTVGKIAVVLVAAEEELYAVFAAEVVELAESAFGQDGGVQLPGDSEVAEEHDMLRTLRRGLFYAFLKELSGLLGDDAVGAVALVASRFVIMVERVAAVAREEGYESHFAVLAFGEPEAVTQVAEVEAVVMVAFKLVMGDLALGGSADGSVASCVSPLKCERIIIRSHT